MGLNALGSSLALFRGPGWAESHAAGSTALGFRV